MADKPTDGGDDDKVIDLSSRRSDRAKQLKDAKAKGEKKKGRKPVPSLVEVLPVPTIEEVHAQREEREAADKAADAAEAKGVKRIGRPPAIEATPEVLRRLSQYNAFQLTQDEAAACFGISRITFAKFLANSAEAREAWEMGESLGRVSVKRAQFVMAHYSATMAIWFGKQHLGQADKIEQKSSVESNTTTTVIDHNAQIQAFRERVGIGRRSDPATTH